MIYRFTDYMFIMFAVFGGLVLIIAMGVAYDKIEINFKNDYLEEFSLCSGKLERLTLNCPDCPDCVCTSRSGLTEGMIGFLWGAVAMILIIHWKTIFKKNKLKKHKR